MDVTTKNQMDLYSYMASRGMYRKPFTQFAEGVSTISGREELWGYLSEKGAYKNDVNSFIAGL